MSTTKSQPDTPKSRWRWIRLTPDRVVLGLAAVEGCLLLSDQFGWLGFNEHRGRTALIALATMAVALLFLLLWFVASLLFRWRFQYSLRTLLVLTAVVASGWGMSPAKRGSSRRRWRCSPR